MKRAWSKSPAKKSFRRRLLIDSNLLLLYLVGHVDTTLIRSFKRTSQFTSEDFVILCQVIGMFKEILTTPNILTEVSSFANQFDEQNRHVCFQRFALLIPNFHESYVPSTAAAKRIEFLRFGLTDTGIIALAAEATLVLSDDYKLLGHLRQARVNALGFQELKGRLQDASWLPFKA